MHFILGMSYEHAPWKSMSAGEEITKHLVCCINLLAGPHLLSIFSAVPPEISHRAKCLTLLSFRWSPCINVFIIYWKANNQSITEKNKNYVMRWWDRGKWLFIMKYRLSFF